MAMRKCRQSGVLILPSTIKPTQITMQCQYQWLPLFGQNESPAWLRFGPGECWYSLMASIVVFRRRESQCFPSGRYERGG